MVILIIHVGNADAIAFVKKPKPVVIQNNTRTEIQISKTELQTLQDDLITWKNNLEKYTNEILPLETKVKQAETVLKQAKAAYDNVSDEANRLKVVDAQTKLDTARTELAAKQAQKLEAADKVRSINNQIIALTKSLTTKESEKRTKGTKSNTVGIFLASTCISAMKNNLTSPCPTYASLMALNLDNSKKESGVFSFFDGYYHRGKPVYKNDDQLYNVTDYNILIDPSSSFSGKIKTITIQPNFQQYLLPSDMKKENNTRIFHKDRYVDSCTDATISANTWIKTLADTVQYLRSGCTGTLLGTVGNVTDSTVQHDISTSSKYKQAQWLKEAKEKYKTSHIGNDNFTNPSVISDEDQR